ncbi:YjgN family protein [Phyllobacterium zundukense]|uniref:DUF898 domain-containing protein n=1 Tax=Phyllobacterium zundukense TaxID=1867719 RepID=A0A2N9W4B9_9HYPH|nr:DUF898 family protein [Phyllobacterium zundukense]ATU91944.1 hypothetical protein BLM14_10120 [Phyllobacterium zundukense]PIO46587.1 hypothetical protein B5P45_01960 [Phyllobacterium zundukense]
MAYSDQVQFGRDDRYSRHRFTFSGTAKEYFGIWIVNVLLTIITLGIYYAWAKVRRNRYMYGNTALADGRFDYHARPKQILIGQIIVIGFIILYNVLLTFAPALGIILAVIFVIAMPWLIARGLRFNARVTSYRNVRFDFTGRYWGAAKAFFLGPVIAAITLGICAPIASRWMLRYTFRNLLYGGRPVKTEPTLGDLYGIWWLPALLTIGGWVLIAVLIFPMLTSQIQTLTENASGAESIFGNMATVVLLYFSLFVVGSIVQGLYSAGVRNVGFSATTFDGRHYLLSDMPRWQFVWIVISNLIVTIATLGLMRPWATVRLARFQAAHTEMGFDGEIGEILSTIKDTGSAVGAEFMDIEGIAVAF